MRDGAVFPNKNRLKYGTLFLCDMTTKMDTWSEYHEIDMDIQLIMANIAEIMSKVPKTTIPQKDKSEILDILDKLHYKSFFATTIVSQMFYDYQCKVEKELDAEDSKRVTKRASSRVTRRTAIRKSPTRRTASRKTVRRA